MTGAGKGDRYRPVDRAKWDEGWERAFGKRRDTRPRPIEAAILSYLLNPQRSSCERRKDIVDALADRFPWQEVWRTIDEMRGAGTIQEEGGYYSTDEVAGHKELMRLSANERPTG